MSDFKKKANEYRRGDDWQSNFKHINYPNVAASIKSILTKKELDRKLNRLGLHDGTTGKYVPLSVDEQVFRIAVLMDTQISALVETLPNQNITKLAEEPDVNQLNSGDTPES